MKYRRVVNRKLDDATSSATRDEMPVVGQMWPEDSSLPRVVERNGEIVLDEGWVAIDDDADPDPEAGL